jgi:hypothetical protein
VFPFDRLTRGRSQKVTASAERNRARRAARPISAVAVRLQFSSRSSAVSADRSRRIRDSEARASLFRR